MNHPTQHRDVDWRVKWPDPSKLTGCTARHIRTRHFFYIAMCDETGAELVKDPDSEDPKTHTVNLSTLARNYNIVPAGRL